MAKLYASEVGMTLAIRASAIMQTLGIMHNMPVQRLMRDLKLCEIGEGTSEIQRLVIARQLGVG